MNMELVSLSFVNSGKPTDIIRSDADYQKKVQAVIVGPFAIHKELLHSAAAKAHYEGDCFIVTHIPTGCSIATPTTGRFESIEQAKAFIEKIQGFARWEEITQESIRAHPDRWNKLGKRVKTAYLEIAG